MQKSLTQIFNETASAAHDAFPVRLHRLVVLLCPYRDTPVYTSPEIADHLSKNTLALKTAIAERTQCMKLQNFSAVANPNYRLADTTVKMIAVQERTSSHIAPSLFSLNHEIGHLVVEHGTPPPNGMHPILNHHRECAADIYAALLHIQRFDKESLHQTHQGGGSALILSTSPIHYTEAVIERATRSIETADLTNHSLQDIAQLAGELAAEHHLDFSTHTKLCTAFRPVALQYKMKNELNKKIIQQCITIIQDNKSDQDILYAGRSLFRHTKLNNYLKDAAKTNPWYQEALDLLAPEEKLPVAKATTPQSTLAVR